MMRILLLVAIFMIAVVVDAQPIEPAGPIAAVPAAPNAQEFRFTSRFAAGLEITIGQADADGNRALILENCGKIAQRRVENAFNAPGYVLVVYEDGDTRQLADTCQVSIRVFFTRQRHFEDELRANAVEIRYFDQRFGVD